MSANPSRAENRRVRGSSFPFEILATHPAPCFKKTVKASRLRYHFRAAPRLRRERVVFLFDKDSFVIPKPLTNGARLVVGRPFAFSFPMGPFGKLQEYSVSIATRGGSGVISSGQSESGGRLSNLRAASQQRSFFFAQVLFYFTP